jgi:hypothetical protein
MNAYGSFARGDHPHDVLDRGALLGQREPVLLVAYDVAQGFAAIGVGAPVASAAASRSAAGRAQLREAAQSRGPQSAPGKR